MADFAGTMVDLKRAERIAAQTCRGAAWSAWQARGSDEAGRHLAAQSTRILSAIGGIQHAPITASAMPTASMIVSAYLPMRSELDPLPLLSALAAAGCTTALPVVVARGAPLIFRAWRPGDTTVSAGFGTREPPPTQPQVEPDLLLVPLLAFDARGYRLGYGGGFYDRTLRELRARQAIVAVGVAFDEQEIDAVPCLDYDERLDGCVTPSGYRRF